MHGRLSTGAALAVLAAGERGETTLTWLRGRSCLDPAGQVAEHLVRTLREDVCAVSVIGVATRAVGEHHWLCTVRHRDGSSRSVDVVSDPTERARAESCGKAAVPLRSWRAALVPDAG